jgi:hypothetical protein
MQNKFFLAKVGNRSKVQKRQIMCRHQLIYSSFLVFFINRISKIELAVNLINNEGISDS